VADGVHGWCFYRLALKKKDCSLCAAFGKRTFANCVLKKCANDTGALREDFPLFKRGQVLNRSKGGHMKTTAQQETQESSTRTILLITLAMFAAAIFFILWGGYEIMAGYASKNWPLAEGKVTSSYVQKQVRSIKDSSKKPTYYPKVRYQYLVGGNRYTSDRISFSGGEGGEKKSEAEAVVDRYPSGQKVIVYYDPNDPQRAVLERGLIWKTFMPFVAGLGFLVVGIVCLKAYLRDRG
jgi:hypothetical protein